jgi:hypothetical protein
LHGYLKKIVIEQMQAYAVQGLNGKSYLTMNAEQDVLMVSSLSIQRQKRVTSVGLWVRLVNDYVVIERDMNTKPLVDALVQAGVPRERIVLAYAGESTGEPDLLR